MVHLPERQGAIVMKARFIWSMIAVIATVHLIVIGLVGIAGIESWRSSKKKQLKIPSDVEM